MRDVSLTVAPIHQSVKNWRQNIFGLELFIGLWPRREARTLPRINDLTIGWPNSNPLSHSNATLAPQARQARASGENLNYVTLVPQARPSGEILKYLLSC